ncbi:fumarylacetoacetate hydrolase family protein [Amycolatopsis silviterrae]|uniref:Fumarylacetoacetate hydrolase family protein n=1 Tax=Amycolatopsis silviterrae TaxID=1656914 RepID=A0ABW5HLA3_9PSEU
MRVVSAGGRLAVLSRDHECVDVEKASDGRFGSDPQAIYARWDEFLEWAQRYDFSRADAVPFDPAEADAPVPAPRQVFAIGLNYRDHAKEAGLPRPPAPVVFTKYPSSLTGPVTTVALPAATVDWEVELVVVMGKTARKVSVEDAWSYVAGITAGQDLSERTSQTAGPAPQWSLAKSLAGFSPIGPAVVTPDEFDDRDDIGLRCWIDGEAVQEGSTAQLIFPVPELIEYLSARLTLYPGDLIFTGTPAGVGVGRTPPRFLKPGEELRSSVEGVGELVQNFVSGA